MALDFLEDDERVAYFEDLNDLRNDQSSGRRVSLTGWLISTYGMSAVVARQIVEAYEEQEEGDECEGVSS